ncbi:transcription repressor OFP1 [Ziziphus jujuba]|uniref:Transcription repressor n=2 Tax=Ziziphus jujuba TaxID=326968 RepID=A0A6P3ZLQ7_ZIZJJ|nr:transcription repressor OFP1 [Ziziphus jujuba]KAH7542813.1 hypothetical protein FEM48_Zijuj02G0114700 [Ziziphus jujuba var. spinosa]
MMGNYRFRLSDMIPNAWFYKLKDMSKTRKQSPMKKKLSPLSSSPQRSQVSQPGGYNNKYDIQPTRPDRFYKSHRLSKSSDTHFPDPPRRSSKRRTKRKAVYKPSNKPVFSSSVSPHCSCHAKLDSARTKPDPVPSPDYFLSSSESSTENFHEYIPSEFEGDDNNNFSVPESFVELASWSSPCDSRLSSSTTDIIIDLNEETSIRKTEKLDGFDMISELELPPISTKPMHFDDKVFEAANNRRKRSSKVEEIKGQKSLSVKSVREESFKTQREQKTASPLVRKLSSNSTGIRLRANSPRLASKKIQGYGRKSVSSSSACMKSRNKCISESFAVVKSSVDPQRDFMDSMMEMIVENNIRASKDLEELLASYLLLNSNEYHELIVKAFEQIWFDMADMPK